MTTEIRDDRPAGSRRKDQDRLLLLLGLLLVMSVGYVVHNVLGLPTVPSMDAAKSKEDLEYEARVLPTEKFVLGYLEGQVVAPTDSQGAAISGARSFTLDRGSIHDLTIQHEGDFFTTASFRFDAISGPHSIVMIINHHPTDGTYVFDSFRVVKAFKE